MGPLGDLLTTHPILTGWEFTSEQYSSWQFKSTDNTDPAFGNHSVWTLTRITSDSPELLLTLHAINLRMDNL